MKKGSLFTIILILMFSLCSIARGNKNGRVDFVPNEIIVKFQEGFDIASLDLDRFGVKGYERILRKTGKLVSKYGIDRLYLLKIKDKFFHRAIEDLRGFPLVEYAEPNYIVHTCEDVPPPNDPGFGELYGLHNTGQENGTPDADIDALEAWNIQTGIEAVLIAVIDTGIAYNHPDLSVNIWENETELNGEIGKDDDGNGYVDDIYGWDFYNDDNDPFDDNGHGTHCAGIIGAEGNNDIGIVGVNWNVKIMPLKFLGAGGSGTTADAISAIGYATDMGVHIMNNSWGGGGFSEALKDAIEAANSAGILFVAAAGNSNSDNDSSPHYPSDYDVPNIVAVAATDRNDERASFSSYGAESVDLGAPGVDIYSTVPTGDCPNCESSGYTYLSGTSMAAPHVSGVAGLIRAQFLGLTSNGIKSRLLLGVDPVPSLQGITLTGGRLNAYNCLEEDTTPPGAVGDLCAVDPTFNSVTLTWTATGDDGLDGSANSYDVRYSTSPITEDNWDSARRATGEPRPNQPGFLESFTVRRLSYGTTYYFAMKVVDNVGNPSDLSNQVDETTTTPTIIFEDDMENGVNGWTSEGLWHQETRRSSSPTTSWAYNTGHPKYNYYLGHNWGGLTSRVIDLSTCSSATLRFRYWYHTEDPFTYWDQRWIQVRIAGDVDFTDIAQLRGDPMREWNDYSLDISSYVNEKVEIRFFFDTIDKMLNKYEGWYIDDVVIFDEGEDVHPPTPNPPVWEVFPRAIGSTSIKMSVAPCVDPSGVMYFFKCIPPGDCHDRDWDPDPSYQDTGLEPNTEYTYRVKACDSQGNETGLSEPRSAATYCPNMHVESITTTTVRGSKGRYHGQVTVTIIDNCGNPVSGATVDGTFYFEGNYEDEHVSGTTNALGWTLITSSTQAKNLSYKFCVDSVIHSTLTYVQERNMETCESH